jgi:hypothetical protein
MIAEIKAQLRKISGVEDDAKKDLLELARDNSDHIKKLFAEILKEIDDDLKNESYEYLKSLVKDWGLSVNIGWRKVDWLLENGKIPTTYEIAMAKSVSKQMEFEPALKELCNEHYELRIKFNMAIKDEELFKYTALNIGNLGVPSFGEFCLFFENDLTVKFSGLTFIKGNSLDDYRDATDGLNMEKLFKDISTVELVNELVSIKHIDDIVNKITKSGWSDKVCCNDCYVEGIVIDELKIENVQCVKIDAKYDTQYTFAAFDFNYDEEISEIDAAMANNYLLAKEKLIQAGLNIKIV